ncbi:hypothetical protein HY227_02020 [Candidatus Wolfebacteria bacterium]|nr:hypothetical protein [Candidatus Wolfebacteria bacterium]
MKKQNTKDETRRFGGVLENIDSKLDLVVEGQEALSEKMDKNHQEFKEFRDEVNYKFEVVFDELRIIRNELKEKISRDEFSLLEKRVIKLEKRLTTAK